jgi:hypothetical protein
MRVRGLRAGTFALNPLFMRSSPGSLGSGTRITSLMSAFMSFAPLLLGLNAQMGKPSLEAWANWVHWRTIVSRRNSG